jgi:isochorismate pyruvate lyase
MADVRVEIDRIDATLIELLAERAGYIDRASQLKPALGLPARIDDRVEDVVAKVRARSMAEGLDPALVETLWRQLIDWSIAREEAAMGAG